MAEQQTPRQLTDTVVMISPDQFGFNPQTAKTNDFQHVPEDAMQARNAALEQFKGMVGVLRQHDLEVIVLPTPVGNNTYIPDAIFPNNWFSHHQEGGADGTLVIYPMLTPNRRAERQIDNLRGALTTVGIQNPTVIDMTADENNGRTLEGTGSLVLDRINKIAYALESERTTREEFDAWCQKMGYEGVFFHAVEKLVTGNNLYHTNVEMSIGDGFTILCPEAIPSEEERAMVEAKLREHGELITITPEQMGKSFCGNILQVQSKKGEPKIIMSQAAFDAFTEDQRQKLGKYGELVPVNIPTIEYVGGGSARCMLAEVFPPQK